MENDRKIKSVVFGRLDGTNKRGRPHKEWMGNITDWCGAKRYTLELYNDYSYLALYKFFDFHSCLNVDI